MRLQTDGLWLLGWSFAVLLAAPAASGCDKRDKEVSALESFAAINEMPPPEEIDPADAPGHKFNDWKQDGNKKGAGRWKDSGVYVDGEPVGVLAFAELPITLQPVWFEEEISARKRPGSNDPGFTYIKQRRYRFIEYFKAVGIPIAKIKEVHVYGPKLYNSIVVSGDELRARGNDFQFRFGSDIWGKPIPIVPEHFGNGKSPDKLSAVLVYIDKKPPTLVRNTGMFLDGDMINGIPYYGEPMRGGVRIYVDDRLANVVKRKTLDEPEIAKKSLDEKGNFKFFAYLETQGVDTKHIQEAWLIRAEKRVKKYSRDELLTLTFSANAQAKGEIQIGEKGEMANAIALHSKPVRPEQLPVILPHETLAPTDDEGGE